MTLIDRVRLWAEQGLGAEDIAVKSKGRITAEEAWSVIKWWSDVYGRRTVSQGSRRDADRSAEPARTDEADRKRAKAALPMVSAELGIDA